MTNKALVAAALLIAPALSTPAFADNHGNHAGMNHNAASDITNAEAIGRWEGSLDIQGTSLRVVFELMDEDEDGILEAMAYSPDQSDMGMPTEAVALEANVLTINVPAVGATYEGTYNGEAFVGAMSQGGMNLPLTLTRAE